MNLWHGIPLKRLLYAANDATLRHTDRVPYRAQERRGYAGLIASSDIDSYAMACMFYPLNYRQVWITGLPRNDFLVQDERLLPTYIRNSLETIRLIRGGKRLVIYAPTYRQTSVSKSAYYYNFSKKEIETLKHTLCANGAILGYRPHYFKNSENYFNLDSYIDNEFIFDMSQKVIPEFSALTRELDLLVTDYSSVYIEALYLRKPVICFGYDIDNYIKNEDGLLYDMDLAFPGPLARNFDELINLIKKEIKEKENCYSEKIKISYKIFFKYQDSSNSERVKREIFRHLYSNEK